MSCIICKRMGRKINKYGICSKCNLRELGTLIKNEFVDPSVFKDNTSYPLQSDKTNVVGNEVKDGQ